MLLHSLSATLHTQTKWDMVSEDYLHPTPESVGDLEVSANASVCEAAVAGTRDRIIIRGLYSKATQGTLRAVAIGATSSQAFVDESNRSTLLIRTSSSSSSSSS